MAMNGIENNVHNQIRYFLLLDLSLISVENLPRK
jgi:hypothetical protein